MEDNGRLGQRISSQQTGGSDGERCGKYFSLKLLSAILRVSARKKTNGDLSPSWFTVSHHFYWENSNATKVFVFSRTTWHLWRLSTMANPSLLHSSLT